MQELFGVTFWLNFIYFIASSFITFYIPGNYFLTHIDIPRFNKIIITIILGVVLWGWQSYIFGFLGIRGMSYFYIVFFTILYLLSLKISQRSFFFPKISSFTLLITTIVIVGVFIQVSAVWYWGIHYNKGIFFCCGNTSDALYHLALTNQLVLRYPPFEPGMYGTIVKNYHYWSNSIVADLVRIFKLPLFSTQFQFFPIFVSLFLGLSAITLSSFLKMNKRFVVFFLFFLYFGSDLIYLLVSFMRKEINFKMSSLEDGSTFLLNPPRAFSVVIFFVAVSMFIIWMKSRDVKTGILTALLFGGLVGFKIYTGLFALSGLFLLSFYYMLKRSFSFLYIPILSLLFATIQYIPVNRDAGGFYFIGFSLFENFIVQPWMMLERLEQARVIYAQHNNILRVIQYELMFIFIYCISIFGFKLTGIIQTKKSLAQFPTELNIFFLGGFIVSAIFGFFFQQTSGGANTFNFLVSIFIFSSIYSALAWTYWTKKMNIYLQMLLFIFLIAFSLPRILFQTNNNVDNILRYKGFTITNDELQGLQFLSKQKTDFVLVKDDKNDFESGSLYYGVLSDVPLYLSGVGILRSHGVNIKDRRDLANIVFTSKNRKLIRQILLGNNISHLVLPADEALLIEKNTEQVKTIFRNKTVKILFIPKN